MLDRSSIARVIEDLLRAGITASGGGAELPPAPWPDDLAIGPDGLGVDSLDLLTLAGAVNQLFHVHASGIEDALLARRRLGSWIDLVQTAWQAHPDQVTFLTSGSTGAPKRCSHRMADLLAEAHEHAARLQPGRILSAVPAHHIYGFIFTVLLPLLTGCDVVDIRNRLPADVRPGDLIISFPDHWRYLAQSLETLPALVGVTSTAPMPPALAHDLRAHGLARLVEIYGSSETAGIGWRDHPDLPFRLLDIWTVAEAPDPEGILLLSRGDRIVATPDLVAMADPRCCHVVGRIDGAVQVGGVNVYPARVAAALATHPLVAEIRVRPADGRLKALVVPKPADADPDSVRRTLFTWIAANLPVAERPRSITVLPRLPTGALGKAQDWAEPPDAGFDANMASQMTTSFRIKATNATSRQPSGITNCMGHHALK